MMKMLHKHVLLLLQMKTFQFSQKKHILYVLYVRLSLYFCTGLLISFRFYIILLHLKINIYKSFLFDIANPQYIIFTISVIVSTFYINNCITVTFPNLKQVLHILLVCPESTFQPCLLPYRDRYIIRILCILKAQPTY